MDAGSCGLFAGNATCGAPCKPAMLAGIREAADGVTEELLIDGDPLLRADGAPLACSDGEWCFDGAELVCIVGAPPEYFDDVLLVCLGGMELG